MAFIKDFRDFAMKGNVIDLAVGIIIGAAFSAIVKSLVDDIITPLLLTPALEAAHIKNLSELVIPGTAVKYGNFLSNILSFIIVAFALFLLVKGVHAARKKEEDLPAAPPAPSNEEKLLMEIRDAIKAGNQFNGNTDSTFKQ